MSANERKPRFAVIQGFAVGLPSDNREICPIVLGVAAHAVLTSCIWPYKSGVQSPALYQALANFGVTLEALQLDAAGTQIVAFRAIERTRQRLVSSGKGAGRNLRAHARRTRPKQEKKDDAAK